MVGTCKSNFANDIFWRRKQSKLLYFVIFLKNFSLPILGTPDSNVMVLRNTLTLLQIMAWLYHEHEPHSLIDHICNTPNDPLPWTRHKDQPQVPRSVLASVRCSTVPQKLCYRHQKTLKLNWWICFPNMLSLLEVNKPNYNKPDGKLPGQMVFFFVCFGPLKLVDKKKHT